MITGIGMYCPHGCHMSCCSLLLTDGLGKWKLYTHIGGVLSFQGVHGAEPLWSWVPALLRPLWSKAELEQVWWCRSTVHRVVGWKRRWLTTGAFILLHRNRIRRVKLYIHIGSAACIFTDNDTSRIGITIVFTQSVIIYQPKKRPTL